MLRRFIKWTVSELTLICNIWTQYLDKCNYYTVVLHELIHYTVDHNVALDDCTLCHGLVNQFHMLLSIVSSHSSLTILRELQHSLKIINCSSRKIGYVVDTHVSFSSAKFIHCVALQIKLSTNQLASSNGILNVVNIGCLHVELLWKNVDFKK